MYPNPCPDNIMIQLNEQDHDTMKAEIFSILGNKILEADFPKGKNSITINMSSLPTGIYF